MLDVWHNVHSQQHTYMSTYWSNKLGLSHWDPYAMRRGGCLKLCYCNLVDWFWCDSILISTTNWFNRPRNDLSCVEWEVQQPTSQLYTVFLLNTAVYHLAVLTISTLPTKHNLLSFVHTFVINRLNFSKICIGTCIATSQPVPLYHRFSNIKEQRKKKKQV